MSLPNWFAFRGFGGARRGEFGYGLKTVRDGIRAGRTSDAHSTA